MNRFRKLLAGAASMVPILAGVAVGPVSAAGFVEAGDVAQALGRAGIDILDGGTTNGRLAAFAGRSIERQAEPARLKVVR